jgi:hypothetical protein
MKLEFTIHTAGWLAIVLEVVLLLIWVYSVFGPGNGTDPAGRGMAQVFLLGLLAYIAAGVVLMLVKDVRCTVAVLVMAAVPLTLVVIGLVKYYSSSRNF